MNSLVPFQCSRGGSGLKSGSQVFKISPITHNLSAKAELEPNPPEPWLNINMQLKVVFKNWQEKGKRCMSDRPVNVS